MFHASELNSSLYYPVHGLNRMTRLKIWTSYSFGAVVEEYTSIDSTLG